MKNFNTIDEFVTNVSRGTFGIDLITCTIPTMRKTNNPYFGRVHKMCRLTNVALGYDYENVINARLKREGKECDFEAVAPTGKHWVKYPYILASSRDEKQHYLRTTMRKNTKVDVVYLLDGHEVTNKSVLDEIKSFMPTKSVPKNQGLEEGNEVIVRDYKLEGIIALSQGEKVYNVNPMISVDMLRKIFFK